MSDVLGQKSINALMVAIHKAIVATFDAGDWRSLGFQTGTLKEIERHGRLLQSLRYTDADYPGHAMTFVTMILDRDLGHLNVMLNTQKIRDWLRANEPVLYTQFFDDEPSTDGVPPADHAAAVHKFLWRSAANPTLTKGFRQRLHDAMLDRLVAMADDQLPGGPKVAITQSLHDSGCDMVIEWAKTAKYGVQMKSYKDIADEGFATKTLAQIQDSKQHGLNGLYVLLAGDLTSASQIQKVRNFISRVSKMKDKYVQVVPPERLWTLLFGDIDEG
jgi:hypothetical protein